MEKQKKKVENFEGFKISQEELKNVKGGWIYWTCRGGMTGQGEVFESWMCPEGVASILVEV